MEDLGKADPLERSKFCTLFERDLIRWSWVEDEGEMGNLTSET